MRKIIKNISVAVIWLAWLVLTAHLMIPHDHHLLESFNAHEESCPASNGNSNHHNEFPIHCHAFNDLASEKATTFVIKKNIHSDNLFSGCFPELTVPETRLFSFLLLNNRELFPDSFLLQSFSLRAPPCFS